MCCSNKPKLLFLSADAVIQVNRASRTTSSRATHRSSLARIRAHCVFPNSLKLSSLTQLSKSWAICSSQACRKSVTVRPKVWICCSTSNAVLLSNESCNSWLKQNQRELNQWWNCFFLVVGTLFLRLMLPGIRGQRWPRCSPLKLIQESQCKKICHQSKLIVCPPSTSEKHVPVYHSLPIVLLGTLKGDVGSKPFNKRDMKNRKPWIMGGIFCWTTLFYKNIFQVADSISATKSVSPYAPAKRRSSIASAVLTVGSPP